MSANAANLGSMVQVGRETPADVKDEAFRLWVENGRSWRRVSEQTGVALRTLHHWGSTENWEQRRRDQAAAFLPGMTTETAFALKLAAHNASLRLQQIAWEANELGIKADAKEVTALLGIVDRGGHSPVGKHGPLEVDFSDTEPTLPDFSTMTHEELRAYDEATRKQRQRKTAVATSRT